jgi:transcriptional regulator with XRE-family HTH domain
MAQRTWPVKTDVVESLCEELHWSQADLSKKAYCSPQTLTSLYKKKTAYLCTIKKLADAFGKQPDTLIDYDKCRPTADEITEMYRIAPQRDDVKNARAVETFRSVTVVLKLGIPASADTFDEITDLEHILKLLETVTDHHGVQVLGILPLNSLGLALFLPDCEPAAPSYFDEESTYSIDLDAPSETSPLTELLELWHSGGLRLLMLMEITCKPVNPCPPYMASRSLLNYLNAKELAHLFHFQQLTDGTFTVQLRSMSPEQVNQPAPEQ